MWITLQKAVHDTTFSLFFYLPNGPFNLEAELYPDSWEYNGDNALWAVKKCKKSGGGGKELWVWENGRNPCYFMWRPSGQEQREITFNFHPGFSFHRQRAASFFLFSKMKCKFKWLFRRGQCHEIYFFLLLQPDCNLSRITEEQFWTLFLNSLKLIDILPFFTIINNYKSSYFVYHTILRVKTIFYNLIQN